MDIIKADLLLECLRYKVDIGNIRESTPCSLEEAFLMRIERLLYQKKLKVQTEQISKLKTELRELTANVQIELQKTKEKEVQEDKDDSDDIELVCIKRGSHWKQGEGMRGQRGEDGPLCIMQNDSQVKNQEVAANPDLSLVISSNIYGTPVGDVTPGTSHNVTELISATPVDYDVASGTSSNTTNGKEKELPATALTPAVGGSWNRAENANCNYVVDSQNSSRSVPAATGMLVDHTGYTKECWAVAIPSTATTAVNDLSSESRGQRDGKLSGRTISQIVSKMKSRVTRRSARGVGTALSRRKRGGTLLHRRMPKLVRQDVPTKMGFPCSHCSKILTTKSRLINHCSIVHSCAERKSFKCSQCSKEYCSKGGLNRHVQVVHDRCWFECKYCWRLYLSYAGCDNHERLCCKRN